jgi:hypothetical protein
MHSLVSVRSADDSEERMLDCVFWASKKNLAYFFDAPNPLILDCTYKTNRFGMPLLLFVSVDSYDKSYIVAACLLSNETMPYYHWAIKSFLKFNNNDATNITVVITDKEMALINALHLLLPAVPHQLCRYHIEMNVVTFIKRKMKEADFKKVFKDFQEYMFETDFLLLEAHEAKLQLHDEYFNGWISNRERFVEYFIRFDKYLFEIHS